MAHDEDSNPWSVARTDFTDTDRLRTPYRLAGSQRRGSLVCGRILCRTLGPPHATPGRHMAAEPPGHSPDARRPPTDRGRQA